LAGLFSTITFARGLKRPREPRALALRVEARQAGGAAADPSQEVGAPVDRQPHRVRLVPELDIRVRAQ
jgi:hypothetical protein